MSKKKEKLLSLSLLFVGLIWGFGFVGVQFTIEAGMSPILNNLLRFTIATFLTMIVFRKAVFSIKLVDLKVGFFPSAMLALGFFLQNTGMQMTTPGNSAMITGSYIVLVPFISYVFAKVRPNKNSVISALVTFCGIAILSFPTFSFTDFKFGDALVFLSAICFAAHFILLDKALKKVSSSKLTFIQVMFTALLFAIMFISFDTHNVVNVNWEKAILPVLYLGFFSSFLAYCLQTYAQKFVPATKVAVLMSSEALFGAELSILLGFEKLTVSFVVGGIITFCGIILAQIPSKTKTDETSNNHKNEDVNNLTKENNTSNIETAKENEIQLNDVSLDEEIKE